MAPLYQAHNRMAPLSTARHVPSAHSGSRLCSECWRRFRGTPRQIASEPHRSTQHRTSSSDARVTLVARNSAWRWARPPDNGLRARSLTTPSAAGCKPAALSSLQWTYFKRQLSGSAYDFQQRNLIECRLASIFQQPGSTFTFRSYESQGVSQLANRGGALSACPSEANAFRQVVRAQVWGGQFAGSITAGGLPCNGPSSGKPCGFVVNYSPVECPATCCEESHSQRAAASSAMWRHTSAARPHTPNTNA